MRRAHRGLFTACVYAVLVSAVLPVQASQPVPVTTESVDTLVIRFAPGTAASARGQAHQANAAQVHRSLAALNVDVVRVAPARRDAAIAAYRNNPNVVYVEPNYRHRLIRPATDEGSEPGLGLAENFTDQWALHNTGQDFGLTVDPVFGTPIYPTYTASAGADINAPEGWAVSTGSASVAIAVLDTGVDCNHLDISGKCVENVNFVSDLETEQDFLGHGTHVAGTAAASTNNNIGVAGVGYDSSIGSLKVCYQDVILGIYIVGQCDDDDIAAALIHAADSPIGYKVVNMSLAGTVMGQVVADAIDYAWSAGLVLVGAAGNNYATSQMLPAAYPSVIGVAASDHHDNLAGFSNFGPSWVSVMAPGFSIMSTVPGPFCGQSTDVQSDCYDWKSGTSMAAPHVAGLAALLFAHNSGIDNVGVRDLIESNAANTGTLGQAFGAWVQYGRIDMAASLGDGPPPPSATVSLQSIALSTVNAGRGSKHGRAVVTLVDDNGTPVASAQVTGDFSGSYNETANAASVGDGSATLLTASTVKGGVSFDFCVTGVTHATLTWDGSTACATF